MKRKKVEEKTQQQDFDTEFSNPLHDEILLWVHNNAADIINQLFYVDWTKEDLSRLCKIKQWEMEFSIKEHGADSPQAKECRDICDIHLKKVPHKPPLSIKSRLWSYPVMTTECNLYFIDMKMEVEDYEPLHDVLIKTSVKKTSLKYRNSFPIDRDDVRWYCNPIKSFLNIEVIAEFKSLSSVLRKIKLCQGHESGGEYCIVSPDDKFEEAIKDQGFFFVKYLSSQ